jgi:hypothetical protein
MSDGVVYNGGKLLANVEVVPIFFGNAWSQSQYSQVLMNAIVNFFQYILASSLMSQLGEYSMDLWQIRHGICTDKWVIPVDVSPGLILPDTVIRDFLGLWQDEGLIPRANDNTLYFLYLPLGVTFDGYGQKGGGCAYHSFLNSYQYAVAVFPQSDLCRQDTENDFDNLTLASSHELCEAITDPQLGGWRTPDHREEICDLCGSQSGRHGPFLVQYVWSNAWGRCLLPPTFAGTAGTPYFPHAGRLTGAGPAQPLFLNRTAGPGVGRVLVADFQAGPPARPAFLERWGDSQLLDGWEKDGDWHLVGNFLQRGNDQVMFLNRQQFGGRILIGDLAQGPPVRRAYLENWGDSNLLDGWEKDGDWHVVGDFLQRGYDQVMFFNRIPGPGLGRVLIADFQAGPPARPAYLERWGDSVLLDGWESDNTWCLVGDFLNRQYDQVMFLNRTEGGGRILIADFRQGPPARQAYLEWWGDSQALDGWEDDEDWCAVGDFLRRGYDQVLFLNRSESFGAGRVLVADFHAGPPATTAFLERWGDSQVLDGWEKDGDWHLVGDFLQRGYDQVMFLNRQQFGGRIMIGDLAQGPPVQRVFLENWGDSKLLDGWEKDTDWYM